MIHFRLHHSFLEEKTMKKTIGRIVLLAALSATSALALATEYTVVVLQSQTGAAAFIGEGVTNGMLLSADDINKKQELGPGNTLKVITADDATDRGQALQLITKYAADPKVLLIMGPTSGASAIAAANAANDLKMPTMTTTNSMEVLKSGPWSFILTQPAQVTIPYIADYAVDKLKVKNCTVIGISDVEAYVTLQKEFETAVKAKGVKIGAVESIKGSDSDFSAVATKVGGRDQDCVFISASAPQSANIIIQLRQAGLDPKTKVIGHNALASPQFVQRGGKDVEGVVFIGDWVPGGYDDFTRAFATAYKAKYGSDADNWAAVGYGGMRVAAAALKGAGANPTRDSVRVALGKVSGVRVAVGQGQYALDAQRVPHVGMNVLVVKDGKFVLAP
jgi:branched-chain amino acid transport system substrate-binding protein